MFIYIAIFIYLLAITYQYDIHKGNRRYAKLNYVVSCILLIVVAGVRYRIGYDTTNYMESYLHAPSFSELLCGYKLVGDPLWMYIMAISKEIYEEFFIVQIIQAIIVNTAVFWFVRRHSPKPFLAILLYFVLLWWNLCFEAMREAIAVAFFLIALDALLSGKGLLRYYLRVWPAIFAHSFGFVTLLFPFIKYLKLNKYTIVIYLLVIVALFSVKNYINDIISLLEMTSDMALTKATKYFDSNIYGESNLSISGILSHIIGGILPCISVILLLRNKPNKESKDLIPFVFVYLCVVILRMQIPIFFRFLNYFEILVIVAFTHAIYLERVKIKRQLVSLVMSGMVFFRLYSLTSYDVGTPIRAYHRYVPYNSIFQRNYNQESEMIFRAED